MILCAVLWGYVTSVKEQRQIEFVLNDCEEFIYPEFTIPLHRACCLLGVSDVNLERGCKFHTQLNVSLQTS